MKVELTKETVYTATINGHTFKDLKEVSQWEGFVKLANSSGDFLVIAFEEPESGFSSAFAEIFSEIMQPRGCPRDVKRGLLIKASHSVADVIQKGPK